MVLTRHQAKLNIENSNQENSIDDAMMVINDPPLLTISRSRQEFDDDDDDNEDNDDDDDNNNNKDRTIKLGTFLERLDDFECSSLDALMARWPSMHARLKGMKPHLPPKKDDNRPTLVLDLDETLLHTYREPKSDPNDYWDADYVVYAKDRRSCLAGILRPGVTEFLVWASGIFEVVVWTAGHDDYAQMVCKLLDPEGNLINHMLSRRTCIRMRSAATGEIMYVKDLCALGRDLGRTFLVDNTPHAATLNLSNLIPIETFLGGSSDRELKELRRFLESNLVRLTDRKNDMRILLHRQLNLKRRLRERIDNWKSSQQSIPPS
ncbi:HAD-like domain-containing protein [Halteromyces radiatus]|uniref:HAD-like domain-containing protein n=1 Tax=Halteromyces radiatus TaxID=101107 RepID=UPI002220726C|nr:HAD-like domain-containing protein [Halteromyces radiatus]KAI8093587.1 HAD-like domain-containing protein [Halteromyces radiatus]